MKARTMYLALTFTLVLIFPGLFAFLISGHSSASGAHAVSPHTLPVRPHQPTVNHTRVFQQGLK